MNNNSNHNTVWILGLIVVLVLGVLIGTNMKAPVTSNVAEDQQGAVAKTTNSTVYTPEKMQSMLLSWANSVGMVQINNLDKNGLKTAKNTYVTNNPNFSDLSITTCVSTNIYTGYSIGASFISGTYPEPPYVANIVSKCITINYPF